METLIDDEYEIYTLLIEAYGKHFNLTYQSLYNFFHQEDLNDAGVMCDVFGNFYILNSTNKNKHIFQNSNYTTYFKKLGKKKQEEFKKMIEEKINIDPEVCYSDISLEQLKKFFVQKNLKMSVLDIHGNIIEKHHPTSDRTNLSIRHFKYLLNGGVVSRITHRIDKKFLKK